MFCLRNIPIFYQVHKTDIWKLLLSLYHGEQYEEQKAAEHLGISESALKNWMKAARENEGSVPTRGTGNYSSDEAKEIARLKRELRDTKDALEILKKAIGILGK